MVVIRLSPRWRYVQVFQLDVTVSTKQNSVRSVATQYERKVIYEHVLRLTEYLMWLYTSNGGLGYISKLVLIMTWGGQQLKFFPLYLYFSSFQ